MNFSTKTRTHASVKKPTPAVTMTFAWNRLQEIKQMIYSSSKKQDAPIRSVIDSVEGIATLLVERYDANILNRLSTFTSGIITVSNP